MMTLLANVSMLAAAAVFVFFSRRSAEWETRDRLARLSLQASLIFLLVSNLLICAILLRIESYAALPGLVVLLVAVIYAGVKSLPPRRIKS
jgi:ABC-type xylose transport system permease subunit